MIKDHAQGNTEYREEKKYIIVRGNDLEQYKVTGSHTDDYDLVKYIEDKQSKVVLDIESILSNLREHVETLKKHAVLPELSTGLVEAYRSAALKGLQYVDGSPTDRGDMWRTYMDKRNQVDNLLRLAVESNFNFKELKVDVVVKDAKKKLKENGKLFKDFEVGLDKPIY